MKVFLTGYTGFLGSHVRNALTGYDLVLAGRHTGTGDLTSEYHPFNLDSSINSSLCLESVDVVIHCAARVHVMKEKEISPFELYRKCNVTGTLDLARQAADAGVKRFIYISSIKVNGESTEVGKPFNADDIHKPADYYGQSKSQAEQELLKLASSTELEVVIIRPTLVYGPGVKANFKSLFNLVSMGLPLPFGLICENRRSLVSVANLVDLIITCVDHPRAINQVFLVSDDNDLSTAGIAKHMASALDKPSRLLPVPLRLLRFVGKLTRKECVVDRLIGSLQVDISHTKTTLGWSPIQTIEQGFRDTAEAFLLNKNK